MLNQQRKAVNLRPADFRFGASMRTMSMISFTILSLNLLQAVDTEAASRARTVHLKTKVSIDATDMMLIDFLKAVAEESEKQLLKPPKWTYAPEVTKAQRITYRCKDKPIEDILADVLKAPGYGYVIVSGESDRLDGFVRITKGSERGFAKGTEPTPEERQALAKLEMARGLIEQGKKLPAKANLKQIVKDYPGTTFAAEATKLLEGLEK